VYGFNDGLTANFGLVAGVLGATASSSETHHHVIVAGVAGLIADALSMGSSGYLAAQSEREVHAHEIAMERDEIALMPEIERDELALIYEAKGMDRESAHRIATQVMADPEKMLAEQVQEELGISEPATSPFREGWITGLATAGRRADPGAAVLLPRRTHRGRGVVRDVDALALARGRRALRLHRTQRVPLRDGHVRRRTRRGGRRLLRWGMDRAAALAARSAPNSVTTPMRSRSPLALVALLVALLVTLASPLAAQVPGPPPTGANGQPVQYYPLYGATLGIAIPAGRLGDEHAAGYHIGGLVEFAVPNQAYALRAEAMYERFPLESGKAGKDVSVVAFGPTIVYQFQRTQRSTFLTGGIAIYHATTEEITVGTTTIERGGGTRPGFNVGTGIAFPLTGFSALGRNPLPRDAGGEQADPDVAVVGGGEVLARAERESWNGLDG
jgi:hypothetical protein